MVVDILKNPVVHLLFVDADAYKSPPEDQKNRSNNRQDNEDIEFGACGVKLESLARAVGEQVEDYAENEEYCADGH